MPARPAYRNFEDLIGNIYDTALDPALWTDILAQITRFVDAQAAGLISKDTVSKAGNTHYYYGVDPHYIDLYSETYARFDPLVSLPRPGQVVSIPDLVSYDDYRRGPFYQEWLRPQGWIDLANVVLENRASNSAILLTVVPSKSRGMVDEEMRNRIAQIAPHMRRALLIAKAIDFKGYEAAAFADTMNNLKVGIFLLDGARGVVHANTSAHAMVASGDILSLIGGRLTARDAKSNRWLSNALSAPSSDGGPGTGSSRLLAGPHGTQYFAHVMPLTSGLRREVAKHYKAVAVLFVQKAEFQMPAPTDVIAQLYKLTASELKVLLAIVEGGGVPETARSLGVAESTVKTHLHRVFEKTGVSRQAEVVKLVAGFSNPFMK